MLSFFIPFAAWYLLAGVATFALYAFDKHAARCNSRRVAERTLHLCSVAGGWPGAWLAQALLRHKSRKRPFRVAFAFTVLLNCGLALLLYLALQRIARYS